MKGTTQIHPEIQTMAESSRQDELERLFPGGSELARLMRALDWSQTDLGPPRDWPNNLRLSVSLCLTSRIPIVMYWGPNFTVLYNDPYISFLGETKHPRYLGQPGRECWREIWETIGPMLESVRATRQATWSEDLLMFFARRLPLEEVFVRFTFGPILADDALTVDGIFTPCTETTAQVVAARRLETLRKLGVKATEAQTAEAACKRAAEVLAENPADIPFAAIYLAQDDGTEAFLSAWTGLSAKAYPLPRAIAMDQADPSPWHFGSVLRSQQPAEVSGLTSLGIQRLDRLWPEAVQEALTLPIPAVTQDKLAGLLVVGISPRRVLDATYRTFFDLVARHLGNAIADARAYEAERKRAEALAELDRAKTAFFSNVSHEFRTPLTLLLGPVEDLLAKSYTELSPSAKGELEVVHRNALRMLKLVNTLLDFSRIEAGRIQANYEPTDLASYTADLASTFRSACERAGLKLRVDCPPLPEPVHVDRDMWEKIILNLLSNAFKFTLEGKIEISLRSEPALDAMSSSQEHSTAILRVRDTGVGIPTEELPHMFERFHRVRETRGRTHEGTGIGLALVQELVKLHGGSAHVESLLGRGSTFSISIPFGTAHLPTEQIGIARATTNRIGASPYLEEALRWLPDSENEQNVSHWLSDRATQQDHVTLSAAAPSAQPVAKPRILWADDNADMREYVSRLLGERYQVEAVPDGEQALAAVRAHLPDLVLTDVMMPRLDGFELLRQLRADPATRTIPVILLSARAGEESRLGGLQAGADDYLIKPFSARELVARVGAHVNLARFRQEAAAAVRLADQRLAAIVASSEDPILSENREGIVTSWNAAAERLFGYSPDEIVGQSITRIIPPELHDEESRLFDRLSQGGSVAHYETVRLTKGGRGIDVALTLSPIRDSEGRIVGASKIVRDITEIKLARETLARSRDQLERLVQERTQELRATIAELEAFSYSLSHDLRAPLRAIQSYIQIALEECTGQIAPEPARLFQDAIVAAARMDRLIQDILALAQLSEHRVQLQPTNPEDILRRIERGRPEFQPPKAELHVRSPLLPVLANETLLAQCLANLLDNAVKFVPRSIKPVVHIWTEQSQSENRRLRDGSQPLEPPATPFVRIWIQDNGIGIKPEARNKIFGIFQRLHSNAEYEGTGIGLAIVRRAIEKMDGRVGVESEHGKGSRFWLELRSPPEPARQP